MIIDDKMKLIPDKECDYIPESSDQQQFVNASLEALKTKVRRDLEKQELLQFALSGLANSLLGSVLSEQWSVLTKPKIVFELDYFDCPNELRELKEKADLTQAVVMIEISDDGICAKLKIEAPEKNPE